MKLGMLSAKKALGWQIMVLAVMFGCGKKAEQTKEQDHADAGAGADSIVVDTALSEEASSAALIDATEALADGNEEVSGSGGLGLTASQSLAISAGFERSCSVDGDVAIVEIDRTLNVPFKRSNRFVSIEHNVEGSAHITRLWSKAVNDAPVPVECHANGKYAAINWKGDISGLRVDVDFERNRSVSGSRTNMKRGVLISYDRSYSAAGERSVRWISQTIDASAGTLTRLREISSHVERKHSRLNARGDSVELNLKVLTVEGQPLVAEVVRDLSSLVLQMKTIKSGAIEVSRNDDGRVVASFHDVTMDFESDNCVYTSGQIDYDIYAKDAAQPSKQMRLDISNGNFTYTNLETGEVSYAAKFEDCDRQNFIEE